MKMEQTSVPTVSKHPTPQEIPWMMRWEKKPETDGPAAGEDSMTRLIRIDYMTMLEELEYR